VPRLDWCLSCGRMPAPRRQGSTRPTAAWRRRRRHLGRRTWLPPSLATWGSMRSWRSARPPSRHFASALPTRRPRHRRRRGEECRHRRPSLPRPLPSSARAAARRRAARVACAAWPPSPPRSLGCGRSCKRCRRRGRAGSGSKATRYLRVPPPLQAPTERMCCTRCAARGRTRHRSLRAARRRVHATSRRGTPLSRGCRTSCHRAGARSSTLAAWRRAWPGERRRSRRCSSPPPQTRAAPPPPPRAGS